MNFNTLKSFSLLPVFVMSSGMLMADCLTNAPSSYVAPYTMVSLYNQEPTAVAYYMAGVLNVSNSSSLFGSSETASTNGAYLQLSSATGFQPNGSGAIDTAVSISKTNSAFLTNGLAYSVTLTYPYWGTKVTIPLSCDTSTGILSGKYANDGLIAITVGTPTAP